MNAEHTSSLDILSQARVLIQVSPMLTLGQGLGRLRPILTWNPSGGPSKFRKGDWVISSLK